MLYAPNLTEQTYWKNDKNIDKTAQVAEHFTTPWFLEWATYGAFFRLTQRRMISMFPLKHVNSSEWKVQHYNTWKLQFASYILSWGGSIQFSVNVSVLRWLSDSVEHFTATFRMAALLSYYHINAICCMIPATVWKYFGFTSVSETWTWPHSCYFPHNLHVERITP